MSTLGTVKVTDAVEDHRPLTVVDGRCSLGRADEIPPGSRKIFRIGGCRGIGVFNPVRVEGENLVLVLDE